MQTFREFTFRRKGVVVLAEDLSYELVSTRVSAHIRTAFTADFSPANHLPYNLVGSRYDKARLGVFIGRWLGDWVVYGAVNEFMDSEMRIASWTAVEAERGEVERLRW